LKFLGSAEASNSFSASKVNYNRISWVGGSAAWRWKLYHWLLDIIVSPV